MAKQGNLSINSENIFPVIKKWLYSDHDIFMRELVSNASDAITKLQKLSLIGEYSFDDEYKPRIDIKISSENKTISFCDNGLGLTEEELVEYITQIAFSGATEFLEHYKDKANTDQIIGHFGLGFYSAFMVADKVVIESLSYKKDAAAVRWECDGSTEYEISDSDKKTVGTTITLYLNDGSLEFSNEYKVREVLDKYCSFMPYEIYLSKENAATEYQTIDEADLKETDVVIEKIQEEAKFEERENENGVKEMVEVSPAKTKVKIEKRQYPINDTTPLFTQNPSACKEEDYKEFYRKVFNDYKEPLFWIHLNMDYPFRLKGILYFPKINTEYDSIEGTIKLYNTQVFVADNVKEVIPEFLLLLKGIIDCPDLPLNVSRSALQNDGFAQKISDYISKKIADKLVGMCKTDRENYEKYWEDINPFVKYGCLKDEKFCDKVEAYVLFKDLTDKLITFDDFEKLSKEKAGIALEKDETKTEDKEKTQEEKKEDKKEDKKSNEELTLYYVNDEVQQSRYIEMFQSQEIPAIILNKTIDTAYISLLERRHADITFQRVDSDITESFREENEDLKETTEELLALFKLHLGKEKLKVEAQSLKDESISSIMTVPEQNRRMSEMMKAYAAMSSMPMFDEEEVLILNVNNKLVKYLLENKEGEYAKLLCEQLYDLALMSCKGLSARQMTEFIDRNNQIMATLIQQ